MPVQLVVQETSVYISGLEKTTLTRDSEIIVLSPMAQGDVYQHRTECKITTTSPSSSSPL